MCESREVNEELQHVRTMYMYAGDVDVDKLVIQLTLLRQQVADTGVVTPRLHDIIACITKTPNYLMFLSEVVKLANLLLVAVATNATSERSFSALRRVKTYLRTSMKEKRLNHLLLLYVHKKHCDKLDLVGIASDFVKDCEHRRSVFGSFK